MNRILLRAGELGPGNDVRLTDRRARHIRAVLGGRPGDVVKVGILDGPSGTARIAGVSGDAIDLVCAFDPTPPARSRVDLLLALPRPKVMKRLWAPLASLGVRRVFLVNAAKVERNYFDTHWVEPQHIEPLLVEGLEQSGDTRLPEVRVLRRFKPFVEDELDALCPASVRLVAHPGETGRRFGDAVALGGKGAGRDLLLAVGPEGGWTDFELDLLAGHGFLAVSLGWRRLRTDTACVALLALAHEFTPSSGGET